jgi:hypothetical protein
MPMTPLMTGRYIFLSVATGNRTRRNALRAGERKCHCDQGTDHSKACGHLASSYHSTKRRYDSVLVARPEIFAV